jgi:hypothetical protein
MQGLGARPFCSAAAGGSFSATPPNQLPGLSRPSSAPSQRASPSSSQRSLLPASSSAWQQLAPPTAAGLIQLGRAPSTAAAAGGSGSILAPPQRLLQQHKPHSNTALLLDSLPLGRPGSAPAMQQQQHSTGVPGAFAHKGPSGLGKPAASIITGLFGGAGGLAGAGAGATSRFGGRALQEAGLGSLPAATTNSASVFKAPAPHALLLPASQQQQDGDGSVPSFSQQQQTSMLAAAQDNMHDRTATPESILAQQPASVAAPPAAAASQDVAAAAYTESLEGTQCPAIPTAGAAALQSGAAAALAVQVTTATPPWAMPPCPPPGRAVAMQGNPTAATSLPLCSQRHTSLLAGLPLPARLCRTCALPPRKPT